MILAISGGGEQLHFGESLVFVGVFALFLGSGMLKSWMSAEEYKLVYTYTHRSVLGQINFFLLGGFICAIQTTTAILPAG